jgi:hypothetical protein
MKVKNPSGREYYIQRAKDDRMANWCSRVSPVRLEFDGVAAEAYADPDRSDWIYIRFNDTTYCHWAKEAGGFDLLGETSLQISDAGRTYRKRDRDEGDDDKRSSSKKDKDDRSLTREDLEAAVSHLPALREAVTARAAEPATNSHVYSSDFSSVVRQIVNEFHTRPFMYAFDYLSWTNEGRRLMDEPEALAAADLETMRKLLVFHWRSDYWDTDNEHWEHIGATGHLTELLERLAVIAIDMEPEQSSRTNSDKFTWSDGDLSDITFPDASGDTEGVRFVAPGFERYTAAFESIQDKITDKQMVMLRAHYHSGGRAVTMRELAKASGYGDYKIANLQYGSLAKRLLKTMGLEAPLYRERDPIWLLGIAELVNRSDFGLEWHFVMRQEVAKALEELEIV